MSYIKTILFPTACKEIDKDSLKFVLAISRLFGAEIKILHVVEPNMDLLVPGIARHSLIQEQRRTAELKLEKFIEGIDINVNFTLHVEIGLPRESIAHFANNNADINLIAIGSKDELSLSKVIWGSIISNTVELSEVNVLVIPKGIQYQNISKIAFLTPDTYDWSTDQDTLKIIADLFNAKIFITHLEADVGADVDVTDHILLDDYNHSLNVFTYNNGIQMYITVALKRNVLARLFRYSKIQKMAAKTQIPLLLLKH